MGIVVRQSVKTSIVVGVGAVLGAIITWMASKYIINKQEFGFTRTITSQAVTLSQLLLLGLNSTLFVFSHRFANQPAKKRILATITLVVPILVVAAFTIVYLFFKEWILKHYQPED